MVTILGKENEFRLTLWAKDQLEKTYGSFKLQDLLEVESDKELYERIIGIARILIQAANLRSKQNIEAFLEEKDLPSPDCWLFMEDREVGDIVKAITDAYIKSHNITVEVQPDPKTRPRSKNHYCVAYRFRHENRLVLP